MTGEPFVDAAMREMYVTGTMHNRAPDDRGELSDQASVDRLARRTALV